MTERPRPWKFGLQRPFWRCVRGEADVLLIERRESARAVKENEGIVVIKREVKKRTKDEDEKWVCKKVTVRKPLGEKSNAEFDAIYMDFIVVDRR